MIVQNELPDVCTVTQPVQGLSGCFKLRSFWIGYDCIDRFSESKIIKRQNASIDCDYAKSENKDLSNKTPRERLYCRLFFQSANSSSSKPLEWRAYICLIVA
jgi:hypothetical protein